MSANLSAKDREILLTTDGKGKDAKAEVLNRIVTVVTTAIIVWEFHEAPADYRALSPHGGDEDWLAYVPPAFGDRWISWLEPGNGFGACDVSCHELGDGARVFIGAHS